MPKQDHLLPLIASLSPSEKRYFKLFSSIQTGAKEYLNLFELLENRTEYNPTALSKELGISAGALAERKSYLNQAVMQTLRSFQEETTSGNVRRYIEECWLLLDRKHYEYALEVCEKGLARAWDLELFDLIGQLLRIKYLCLFGLGRMNEAGALTVEHKKASEAASELFEMSFLSGQVSVIELQRMGPARIQEELKHPLLQKKVGSFKSLRTQIDFFDTMNKYNFTMGSFKKAEEWATLEIQHYAKHSKIKQINPIAYVVSFSRLANAESQLGKPTAALNTMQKFEQALEDKDIKISKGKTDSLRYYANTYMAHLYRLLGRYDEAISLNKKCYAIMHQRPAYDQCSTVCEYALSLFAAGNMADSADKFEELIQIKEGVRLDLQELGRALAILIQLDMGNYQLIPHLIKSAKAWMKKHKSSSVEIDLLFSLVYSIAKAPQLQRRNKWLKLQQAVEQGKLSGISEGSNLKTWIDRKLSRA